MKNSKKDLLLIFILALAAIFAGNACNKNKDDQCLREASILKYYNGGALYAQDTNYYYWDKSGRLTRVETSGYSHLYTWGDHTLKIERMRDGDLLSTTTHDLDEKDRSILEKYVDHQGGSSTYSSQRSYDSEGYLQQITTTQANGSIYVSQYTWTAGNLKKIVGTSGSGSSTTTYEYYEDLENHPSNILLSIYGNSSKNLIKKYVQSNYTSSYFYTLGENGLVKTETVQVVTGSSTNTYEYTHYYNCE